MRRREVGAEVKRTPHVCPYKTLEKKRHHALEGIETPLHFIQVKSETLSYLGYPSRSGPEKVIESNLLGLKSLCISSFGTPSLSSCLFSLLPLYPPLFFQNPRFGRIDWSISTGFRWHLLCRLICSLQREVRKANSVSISKSLSACRDLGSK